MSQYFHIKPETYDFFMRITLICLSLMSQMSLVAVAKIYNAKQLSESLAERKLVSI